VTGLNVLLVGPYPQQQEKVSGGIEAVTSTLVPALAAQESIAQLSVLSFRRDQGRSFCKQVNDKLQIWFLGGQQRLTIPTRSFLEVWQARRIAARLRPDIVHGQGIGRRGDIAIQLARPAVVTVHGLVHLEAQLAAQATIIERIRVGMVESMVKRVLSRARVVISISDYDARALDGLIGGQRVSIPNPIAQEFFEESGDAPDAMRILFAGVMVRRKNVEGLLRAFAAARKRVPAARLVIVGPAPDAAYAREIRELVRSLQLGDAVEFVGHVENARLLHEIRICSAVALFSHEETSPTILAQAMAAGKPVVASRVGGISEMVIDRENGFLIDPGDERAFAERLATLLRSPELCRTMGRRGHEMARDRFDPFAVARQTVEAYHLARQRVPALAAAGWR
jgi:glycosyltransferase involved in cell wall biosynthesis